MAGPMVSNMSVSVKIQATRPMRQAGHDDEQADRARVVPDLREDAAGVPRVRVAFIGAPPRGRRRPHRRCRRRGPRRPPRPEARAGDDGGAAARGRRSPRRRAPVSASSSVRCLVGEDRAVAHQEQPVAAGGLVHHVARDEEARADVGEPVEQVPQVDAEQRVEADGRLVEHEQVGCAEERRGERDPAALAARQRRDELVGVGAEVGRLDGPRRRRPCRRPEHAAEVGEVLPHGQVVVDARRLRDVADAVPEGRRIPPARRAPSPCLPRPSARRRSSA